MTRQEFFASIADIKTDKLFITDSIDLLDQEVQENCCSISMSQEVASECTVAELKEFLHEVKRDRKKQLQQSGIAVGLIFYLWNDDMAQQIRFNFINSNHKELPFGAPLIFVESEDQILHDYLTKEHENIDSVRVYKELILQI